VKVLELFPGPNGKIFTLKDLIEKVLICIWESASVKYGRNPRRWKWGRYHKLHFRHPGAEGKIKSWLLNRGPWPSGGDWTTVNVSGFSLSTDPGEVTTIPSMRFIASLADKDDNFICLPLGQSGRPGNRFYDNFTLKFRNGGYIPFPMSVQGRSGRAGGVLLLKKS
jgi:penicillin amidase